MKAFDGVLSVGELNEYVRRSLAADPMLSHTRLKGEISNFKRHTSGHWYFSLKDDTARINCVMFRQSNLTVRLVPRDGLQVVLTGSVSLYPRDGAYQFYAEAMKEDGLGDLFLRFEQLKAKLQKEGLFDASRKRPLPLLPYKVGIVTSRTGAVIRDICQVSWRRHPGMNLVLFPAQVQGDGAAEDIVRGIEALGKLPGISVIIVGRGGGSMEDLWAFNEEIVARAIAACPVPVVSAVGHETDFTIADFVADVRASTPSAAAEMTVPILDDLVFTVNELKRRMLGGGEKTLLQNRERLLKTVNRLQTLHPKAQVQAAQSRADLLCSRLKNAAAAYVALKESRYNAVQAKFTALGPMQVMKRGYALALKDGVPVTGVKAIVPGDRLRVLFSDGQVLANALETKEGNPFE
jgi:exodeoxyribonuclease VII large subunit